MLSLSQEQQQLVDSIQELAESEFASNAFSWEDEFPWDNIKLLADYGYLGICVDEKYGGGGLSEYDALLTIEAVGRVCPDTASALVTQQLVGPRVVEMFGSEAAKQRYLKPIVNGEEAMAIAISEPEAGSNVMSMNTSIEKTDGKYILNGEKIWVSGVPHCDSAVVWAKFPESMGAVIIEFDWPGVDIEQHYTNMAGRTQTHFFLEDVEIPEENVLIEGENAFRKQLKALNWERLGSAAASVAFSLAAIDRAVEYAATREQFGQPIEDFQGIEWKLAEMVTETQAARALIHLTAQAAVERGEAPRRLDTSIAKLFASEKSERVVSEALQIHGANGYQKGHPMEYLYRLVRGGRIGGGTDEIMKNQIASVIKQHGLK